MPKRELKVAGVAQDREHGAEGGGREDQADHDVGADGVLGPGDGDQRDACGEPEHQRGGPADDGRSERSVPRMRSTWIS